MKWICGKISSKSVTTPLLVGKVSKNTTDVFHVLTDSLGYALHQVVAEVQDQYHEVDKFGINEASFVTALLQFIEESPSQLFPYHT